MVHSWTFFLIIILEIYLVFLAMCTGRVLVGYLLRVKFGLKKRKIHSGKKERIPYIYRVPTGSIQGKKVRM